MWNLLRDLGTRLLRDLTGSSRERQGLLETAAFAAFLWLGLRSAEAICGRALHPAWTALPAAAIAASRAFSHGGSAEELLLPLLAPDLLDDLPPPALDQILGLLAGMLGLPF